MNISKTSPANEQIEVKVQKLSINGEGLFSYGDKRGAVSKVLPGEMVKASINKTKKDFMFCSLEKVLEPSSDRTIAPCPYYDKCGGCNFMHVAPQKALEIKRQVLGEYFRDYYVGDIVTHPSPCDLDYRNKVSFSILGTQIGFKEPQSNNIVEVDSCLVAKKQINKVLSLTKQYLIKINNTAINHLVVRCLGEGVCVVLVATSMPAQIEHYANLLKKSFGDDFGLFVNFGDGKNEILSKKYKLVAGHEYLTVQDKALTYYVYPDAFMQINDGVRVALYSRVCDEIDQKDVVEGYSGVGILSAYMSSKASSVTSIEINSFATKSAQKLKENNKIDNLTIINDDFGHALKTLKGKKDFTLVVDPARSGLDKNALDAILEFMPNKIVYVSCNPYTLKQNIGYLKGKYKVQKIELFDMFVQTFDIETLAVLQKV